MEKLLEILDEIDSTIDYEKEKRLIDEGYLDSLSILSLVTELEDGFDIEIRPVDLVPANFNSVEAMWNMIQRLQRES
ncbi:Phosphopantetheine attachment site [Clostridium collagenovorans DSM 3089]|uniref:Phosphopantetheine attachment site n=1 Tax=Clostridium collagenovorans DSM 3089 TaxID=1121306 RepID=A0A1M5SIG2_9CLOT|nr:acyl carrier protein [Clostridium collagenovorans]SHH37683.1 Phosphopantetheine attachment site [Clostridium collagenovorans DSM 3089]